MAKGIVYYKMKSQYDGDITKDCALDGYEVDGNFNLLEGRDIKTVEVDNGDIVITLYNGEMLSAKVLADTEAITNISFDKETGVLSYVQNGETYSIRGFASVENTSIEVASDETLIGSGTVKKPLGISNMYKTGLYKPAKRIIDLTRKEKLPNPQGLAAGERFVSCETVSDYGYLYDYNGVYNIACDLHDSGSKWRIPTKEDWDDMLNAVEPCPEDRNHGSHDDNRNLGRWAGKLLKSVNLWNKKGGHHYDDDGRTCFNYEGEDKSYDNCKCGKDVDCAPAYCGEYSECDFRPKTDNSGIDKYGFRVTPAGYADDGENYLYFKDRAIFWTSKNHHSSSAYIKRFEYNKSTVYQEVLAAQNHLSLRLVKDYNGSNFKDIEQILDGRYSCVLMPSMKNGAAIWTSVNFASTNKKYHGLVPNDGAGVTFSTHYFINEWTGKEWVRTELHEGEGVVIVDAPMGLADEEYRIVEGKLVSISDMVQSTVLNKVGTKIEKVEHKIDHEYARASRAEEELQSEINDLQSTVNGNTESISELQSALEAETEARTAADEELTQEIKDANERINGLSDSLTEAVNKINEEIEAETEARTAADDEIKSEISNINGDIISLQGDVKDLFDGATKNDTIAFDPETGLLTSKTFEGNTNTVQFAFNFGTF